MLDHRSYTALDTLRGCRCSACGGPALTVRDADWAPDDVRRAAIECGACRETYDVIWGTPFIGHYEREDVLGLIEIAANAREDNAYASREQVERLETLLRHYDEAANRPAYVSACSDDFVRAPWFDNRYTEYSSFWSLAKDVDLDDRDILDVGAGSGLDTWRLMHAGGHVTAVEYNPMLVRRGKSVVPEARWIGGFAHALPFENETFDVVCCNAALHHMRDVRSAIHEMLRVLRPGGLLLTVGDPFRADGSDDGSELDVFDSHPDVLLGVNESIPTFGSIVDALVANESRLDVRFRTSALYGLKGWAMRHAHVSDRREWPFAARKRLAHASGSLSMRARVRKPLDLRATRQGATVLRAGDYAQVLGDYDCAVAALVPLLPSAYVDSAFPGTRQTRFELLNGWQKPRPGDGSRTAYRRARWFLTRPEGAEALHLGVKAVGEARGATLEVHVAGRVGATVPLAGGWSETSVALGAVPPGTRFVCELRVALPEGSDGGFDDYRFAVKDRRFE